MLGSESLYKRLVNTDIEMLAKLLLKFDVSSLPWAPKLNFSNTWQLQHQQFCNVGISDNNAFPHHRYGTFAEGQNQLLIKAQKDRQKVHLHSRNYVTTGIFSAYVCSIYDDAIEEARFRQSHHPGKRRRRRQTLIKWNWLWLDEKLEKTRE